MRIVRLFLLPTLFLAVIGGARAQAPIQVTPCDLVTSPEKYAGKLVQVRAPINLAFEDFTLGQPGCEDKYPGIWLMYGGDEPTPTASTWNDTTRKPGSVVRIGGVPVPLVHDAALDLFKRRLTAMRLGKIGDSECYNCYLYNVTATLTGMFFAVVNDGKSQAGYGHAGCCHLLAIERVEDVAAVRTAVRAGASFKCTHESKDLTQEDAERLGSIYTSCKGISRQACDEMSFRQMAAVASLWGDTLDADAGFLDGRLIYEHTEESGWRTSDRSKFYKLFIQSENPLEDGSSVLSGKVSRVICTVVTPPIPQAANMSCREYSKKLKSMPSDSKRKSKPSDWGEDLTKNPQEIRNLEDASAGMFEQAAKELGISIEPGMKPASCEAPLVFGGKEIGSCSWVNETGTMRIGISLMRTWPLKKNDKQGASSWVLTSAGADVCEVEK